MTWMCRQMFASLQWAFIDETIADAFEAAFDRVAVVGDTANPGNIADATSSGYAKAFVF